MMRKFLRILIAEVDIKIVAQVKKYLVSFGHRIFPIVTTGEDLMKQVSLLNPSLIITDINLNGQLDGVEAIARLENNYNIPYIFITANDDYSNLIYSYNLNPVSIIKRPIDLVNLHESFERVQLPLEMV